MKNYVEDLWASGKIKIKVNLLSLIKLVRKIIKLRKKWLLNHGKDV
jgi:hypothetical protein